MLAGVRRWPERIWAVEGIGGIRSWDPARSHQPVPPQVPGRDRDAAARVRAAAVAARAGPNGPPGHPAIGVALRGAPWRGGARAAVIWCVPPGVVSGLAYCAGTGQILRRKNQGN